MDDRNIVLIGFMGAGKSMAAKELAVRFSREVLATDKMVEVEEGRSIAEIFKDSGEAYFRDKEQRAVASLAGKRGMVIDCGGGIFLNPNNQEVLKTDGIVFYLAASVDQIYERIKGLEHRPLLNTPDPRKTIAELLEGRKASYEQADYTIDTDGKVNEQVCDEIETILTSK